LLKSDVTTTIITSRDDPFVPFEMFAADRVAYPDCVQLLATDQGGHVGFIGQTGDDPDNRWLDARYAARWMAINGLVYGLGRLRTPAVVNRHGRKQPTWNDLMEPATAPGASAEASAG
jgi:hypothetical protein